MNFDHIFNALTGLSEISIWWMIWQDYRKARGKEEIKVSRKHWVGIAVCSLIPLIAVGYYQYVSARALENTLPEDTQENAMVRNYGWKRIGDGSGNPSWCYVEANGKRFEAWKDKYHLAFACFVWNGEGDSDDATQVLGSKPYQVTNDLDPMFIYWNFSSGAFGALMKQTKDVYVNFALFMVPNGVDIEHIYSVRQAKALGARQVWHASAGPS